MTLDELLRNPKALPTAPKVLAELIQSFDDPHVPSAHISRTLSADPVLSAKLLRLANSAYYNRSRSVATVDDAVRMLGFVTVRTLVVSSGLVNGFKHPPPGLDLPRFWRYSLNTACASRWIANKSGEDAELAFTIGLMHAIGLVIMHAGMPAEAHTLDDVAGPYQPGRIRHEMEALGFSFYDVSAGLAQRWKFPNVFTHTIRDVPAPLQAAAPDRLVAVVHLAVWRAQRADAREAPDDVAGEVPLAVAAILGLEPGQLLEEMPALTELSAGLEELIS